MNATTATLGYVITDTGEILVQVPDDSSKWGFFLSDEDESWDGGFGAASSWELIDESDPRITDEVKDRLGWILDEHRDA